LGWAYCSKTCKAKSAERQETKALLAGVGMDAPTKRKCEACGEPIPNWRNGRRVSKTARFCSRRCSAKARKGFCRPKQQNGAHFYWVQNRPSWDRGTFRST
jgi:hypothetical protein